MKKQVQGLIQVAPAPQMGALMPHRPLKEALAGYLSEGTKRAYKVDVEQFFGMPIDQVSAERVLAVRPPEVADWRDRMMATKKQGGLGLKPNTVARKLSALRSMYDYLIAGGYIAINPAHPKLVRSPKRPNVMQTDKLSWDEAVGILSAPNRAERRGRRDYALLLMDTKLGLRREELMSLRIEDLKNGPTGPYAHVHGKGEKERLIEIRPDLIEALNPYLKDRGDHPGYLWPSRNKNYDDHLSEDLFWRIVKKYSKAAGISGKSIHPHSLRAAFVTLSLQKGTSLADVQKSAGHSRGETTLRYSRDLEMIKSKATASLDGLKASDTPIVKLDLGSQGGK